MGVPKFFRWLTERFPQINRRISEGRRADDYVDNFYLDMNGIIHTCTHGDDIRPEHMRAFAIPAGRGVYLNPGTWHNGVYALPRHCPARFLTRQGRVHARVSASWAAEFGALLRVPLGVLAEQ